MAIRSMTGYGQASAEISEGRFNVELRSLNHRYADLRLKLPTELAAEEADLRRRILKKIKRGRVEVSVAFEPTEGRDARPVLNRPLLEEVLKTCEAFRDEYRIQGQPEMSTLLAVSGMFRPAGNEQIWGDEHREAMNEALDRGLATLQAERCREGRHLGAEMLERLAEMDDLTSRLRARAAVLPDLVRDRLLERLKSLASSVELDAARTAQEAAILADRCDVTEEIVRLEGHLQQARALLEQPDEQPLGKRMDFLLQEINRETNTVNSKSPDLEMSRFALSLKAEIEKMREQAQNLE